MRRLGRFLFGALLVGVALQGKAQKALLWEVKAPGSEKVSHLFGTYHLVGATYLDKHTEVKKSFEEARTVVVETVIDSSRLMSFVMASMMQESLKKLVDSAEYHLLKQELEPLLGFDLAQMDNFKPVMLAATYSLALAQKNTPEDFSFSGDPIDQYFAAEGKKRGKEIVTLEDMLEQADLLFNTETVQEQAEDLVQMVVQKEEATAASRALIKAYKEKDLQKMEALGQEWAQEYGGMEALLDERNKKWIPRLKEVFEKGDAFAAVGALHLTGKNSLLKLLREAGYTVRPAQ